MTLILKHANKNRLGAIDWDPNDFDVCASDHCIGRIFLLVQAPQGRPWYWTITAREYPPTIHSRGYSATREQAMAAFKAQWMNSMRSYYFTAIQFSGMSSVLPPLRSFL
jgi:hypothetical protein